MNTDRALLAATGLAGLIALSALIAPFIAGPAAAGAQAADSDPSQAAPVLSSGFSPDPYRITVQAGGWIEAETAIGSGCYGYIAEAPDVELTFFAGARPLILSAASNHDVALAVRGPDGVWRCDDNSGEGDHPSISFQPAQSGRYAIWIGTHEAQIARQAELSISELMSE